TPRPEPPSRLTRPAHLRASDEDRRRAVAELQEHFVAGRVTSEELSQRVEQALAAKTFGDLALVLHDLPANDVAPPPALEPAPPAEDRATRREQRRERRRERRRYSRHRRGSLRAHVLSYAL